MASPYRHVKDESQRERTNVNDSRTSYTRSRHPLHQCRHPLLHGILWHVAQSELHQHLCQPSSRAWKASLVGMA